MAPPRPPRNIAARASANHRVRKEYLLRTLRIEQAFDARLTGRSMILNHFIRTRPHGSRTVTIHPYRDKRQNSLWPERRQLSSPSHRPKRPDNKPMPTLSSRPRWPVFSEP